MKKKWKKYTAFDFLHENGEVKMKNMERDIENIVILCEFAQYSGGSQNIAINSALEFAQRGYKVYFFTAIGEECEALRKSDVIVKHLHLENITDDKNFFKAAIRGLWNKKAADELQDLLEGLAKDKTIVHIHNWSNAFSSSVVRRASDLGYKTVVTLHDYLVVCPNGGFYNYKHRHICEFEPMSVNCILCNCDRRSYLQKVYRIIREIIQNRNIRNNAKLNFITISKLNDDLIRKRVKSKKIYRVENFVQTEANTEVEHKKNMNFICVGRIVQEKGVEVFCKAIRNLKKKYPKVHGQVLGDGPLLENLKKNYSEVDFLGWVSHKEVNAALSEARCLVFPSLLYECSPLTVIEALTNGLPCIASDCTTATELISDGYNGFLFHAGDDQSLVKKMEEALSDINIERIENNIKQTFDKSKYTCSAYADRAINVYRKIET